MNYIDFIKTMTLAPSLPKCYKQGEEEGLPGFIYLTPKGQFAIELRRDAAGWPVFWTSCEKYSSIATTLKDAEKWLFAQIQKIGGED